MDRPTEREEPAPRTPRELKLDLETPLEGLFTFLGFIGAFVALTLLWGGIFGGKKSPPNPALLKYVPFGLLAAGLGFGLRWRTDNYYVLRKDESGVIYHFETLGFSSERLYLPFSEIHVATVTGRIATSKSSRWYEYRLCLVDLSGEIHPVSDWGRENREQLNKQAAVISRMVGCTVAMCPHEARLRVGKGPNGDVEVSFEDRPLHDAPKPGVPLLVVIAIVGTIIAFLGGIVAFTLMR